MKRPLALLLLLALFVAACGGDDDDDDGSASGGGDDDTEAAAGDFCEVWPSLNSDQDALTDEPSEAELDEARQLLASARASAPEEIEGEVGQMVDAIEGVLDDLASGGELTEESFGELFGLAFSAGPPIEQWLVDNCPDYEPEAGFDDFESDDEAVDGGEIGSDATVLGISGSDAQDLLIEAMPSYQGYSWDGTTFGVYIGEPSEAEDGCDTASAALAEHPDASGEATFEVWDGDGEVLARNASLAAGDAGTCEAT